MQIFTPWRTLKLWQKNYFETFSHDIEDHKERRKSNFFLFWFDHEVLRVLWHNFDQVVPGVYRSNHPTYRRFKKYASMGIKSIINLRGAQPHSPYKFEAEACAQLGIELIDIPLSANQAPPRELLIKVLDVFSTVKKPFLMHCKSGADRTGLVAAIYVIAIEGRPTKQAKKQLSFRYLHSYWTKTGILDHVIWTYEQRVQQGDISFRDWVVNEYDREKITQSFQKLTLWQRFFGV
ncbi:MAG: tyrosine-protein phosphatase [Ahrensia sp.]|nr:tyrosine-protein phosphatase [Ahrensia sp.]